MNVLLIGSGGREHAIAWKVAQSKLLSRLYIAPGNPGTARLGENLAVKVNDFPGILQICGERKIDLVIVGPEAPLAEGLADMLTSEGIRVFGPSRAAARIESSKVFSKDFMQRHGSPTARYATFNWLPEASAYLEKVDHPVVIKASGLAAGKGVILPENIEEAKASLKAVLSGNMFGEAGSEVVIEERLSGPEVTLLGFSDGKTVKAMVPSQDHKRALDGDQGLNTGGMGAYAPVPACPVEIVDELVKSVLQPAVDGLREEGIPFIGVLYGGFMLTQEGARVIEFNCRFGDPETETILPLLESDLLEIALACADGRLEEVEVQWKKGAAACVVVASGGYPGSYATGLPISGLDRDAADCFVFHAGTKAVDGRVFTAGGRVLCVTGWGKDLRSALGIAYSRIESIRFESMQYRKDIGWRALGGSR
jgi:phosphoribosylamine--glycine ligase